MDDDFNTGGAVGVLFELVTALNRFADDGEARRPGDQQPHGEGGVRRRRDAGQGDRAGPRADVRRRRRRRSAAAIELVAGLMQLLLDLRNNLRAEAKEAAKDNPLKKPLFDQTDLIRKRLGGTRRHARRPPRRHDLARGLS